MFRDPIQALSAPPPRYLLESDSSDEEGQGVYPGASASTSRHSQRIPPAVQVQVDVAALAVPIENVVLGIGQAGRYLRRFTRGGFSSTPTVSIVAGRVIGTGHVVEGVLLLVVDDAALAPEAVHQLCETLVANIPARSWTIVTTYLPALYIRSPSASSTPNSTPGHVRLLRPDQVSASSKVQPYESPNYLTGLAAALVSWSAHPRSNGAASVSTYLLPLPLSQLSPSAIDGLFPFLTRPGTWSEGDDEPYIAPGMGRAKAEPQTSEPGDYESMYM